MLYTIKGNPGFYGPNFVMAWLRRIKIEGEKIGTQITFSFSAIREALVKEQVPHVADFLEKNKVTEIIISETECVQENQ